jgi:hypothetical protein
LGIFEDTEFAPPQSVNRVRKTAVLDSATELRLLPSR